MVAATFGAGCFWGVEAAFRQVEGVGKTAVGFMGGHVECPSYDAVCAGVSGHAEVVHLEYDPAVVSYEQLLDIFWDTHDPTQVNQQGVDIGSQYRSAIFFHTAEQEAAALASKQQHDANDRFPRPVATRIEPALTFWPAEEHHQQYFEKRGFAPDGGA